MAEARSTVSLPLSLLVRSTRQTCPRPGQSRYSFGAARTSSPSATAAPADPRGLGAGPRRLPARDVRRLYHGRNTGARVSGGLVREASAQPADHRRTGFRSTFQERCGTALRGVQPALRSGSILVTTNLLFDEWTEVFGSEHLAGTLLDRLTRSVHIIEMNGESYRVKRSGGNAASQAPDYPGKE